MSEKRNRDYAKFDSMTTEELEAILQEDFNKAPEASDEALVLCVLEILEQRAGEHLLR